MLVTVNCQNCGTEMIKNGTRAASNGVIKQRWTCKGCHHSQFTIITPENLNWIARYPCMSLKEVAKTWVSHGSVQLVIPKHLATKAGLERPEHVAVELVEDGVIKVRRVDI